MGSDGHDDDSSSCENGESEDEVEEDEEIDPAPERPPPLCAAPWINLILTAGLRL